jgi:hypothetical protein
LAHVRESPDRLDAAGLGAVDDLSRVGQAPLPHRHVTQDGFDVATQPVLALLDRPDCYRLGSAVRQIEASVGAARAVHVQTSSVCSLNVTR